MQCLEANLRRKEIFKFITIFLEEEHGYVDGVILFDVGELFVRRETVIEPTFPNGTYLTSSNPEAWPDNGYKDGYYTIKCDPR